MRPTLYGVFMMIGLYWFFGIAENPEWYWIFVIMLVSSILTAIVSSFIESTRKKQ